MTAKAKTTSPLALLFHGWERIVLSSAVLLGALGYYNKNVDALLGPDKTGKAIFWFGIVLVLACFYFFNVRPMEIRKRLLKIRPSGKPSIGYFDTSPRKDIKTLCFQENYQYLVDWITSTTAPLNYLTGASGSGKSSIIQSLLIPGLQNTHSNATWRTVVVSSMRQFQDLIYGFDLNQEIAGRPGWITDFLRHIREHRRLEAQSIWIVFDQFEELLLGGDEEHMNSSDDAVSMAWKLGAFLQAASKQVGGNIQVLISYRDDYQVLVDKLGLPRRFEHENWEQVKHWDAPQLEMFLNKSRLNIPRVMMQSVLSEAAQIDGIRTLRPIVANMFGLALQQLVQGPHLNSTGHGILRGYIKYCIGDALGVERKRLLSRMYNDFAKARICTLEQLTHSSGLDSFEIENQLIGLGNWGIVRRLDETGSSGQSPRWQIAHDFVALQIKHVLSDSRPTLWETTRPWLAAIALGLASLSLGWWFAGSTNRAIRALSESGFVWDEKQRILKSRWPNGSVDSLKSNLSDEINKLAPLGFVCNGRWAYVESRGFTIRIDRSPRKFPIEIEALSGVRSLKWLIFNEVKDLVDLAPLRDCVNIERLDLVGAVRLQEIETLSRLTRLRYLSLDSCRSLSQIASLSSLVDLKRLSLASCVSLQDLSPLQHLDSLTEVNLNGCTLASDISPLFALPRIVKIDFRRCPAIRRSQADSLCDLFPTAVVECDYFERNTNRPQIFEGALFDPHEYDLAP